MRIILQLFNQLKSTNWIVEVEAK